MQTARRPEYSRAVFPKTVARAGTSLVTNSAGRNHCAAPISTPHMMIAPLPMAAPRRT